MKWSKKYLHTLLRFGIKSGNDWDDVNSAVITDVYYRKIDLTEVSFVLTA